MNAFLRALMIIFQKIRDLVHSREFREIFDMAVRSAFWTAVWFGVIVFISDTLHAIGTERIAGFFSSHVSIFFEKLGLSLESQRAILAYVMDIPMRFSEKFGLFLTGILITFAVLLATYDTFRLPRLIGRVVALILRNTVAVYAFIASILFVITTARSGNRYLAFKFAFFAWLVWVALYSLLRYRPFVQFVSGKIALLLLRAKAFLRSHPELEKCLQIIKKPSSESLFLSDCALGEDGKKAADNDELGMKDDAAQFARSVLNNGSDVSMVFGIDAPWGSGKSSYLALCREQVWDVTPGVVVFHFNPTLYDLKRQDLFDAFSIELVATLRKHDVRVRRIRIHLGKLARLFKGSSVQFFGLTLALGEMREVSVEDIKNALRKDIQRSGKRIITIIDDLDRLYLEDVKDMLGIVRNVLDIPGVSFVLCYDSETVNSFEFDRKTVHRYVYRGKGGVNGQVDSESSQGGNTHETGYTRESHEPDNQAINAYFEKMVQVKKILIPKREQLSDYFSSTIHKLIDEETRKGFEKNIVDTFVGPAKEAFFSEVRFPEYEKYFGDIRKIKRVLNVVKERGILDHDFGSIDPKPEAVIQLILLYVYHPAIFRDVYVKESGGVGGEYFSIPYRFLDNTGKLQTTDYFKKYTRECSQEHSFLLTRIFDVESGELKDKVVKLKDDRQFQTSSPIFNGPFPYERNLKEYLDLILGKKKMTEWAQYQYHLNKVGDLNAKKVDEVLSEEKYPIENGESPRDVFFSAARKSDLLTYDITTKLIRYILENITSYSLVNDFSGVYAGKRRDLVYEILFLLNKRGWKDESGESYNNSDENVAQIAPRILDEFENGAGILDRLLDPSRGILGIFDAIVLYSGCVTAEESFNLRRALDRYEKDGDTDARPYMARQIFRAFRESYIQSKRSIFVEVEALPNSALLGVFSKPIHRAFKEKGKSIKEELDIIRRSVIGRIIFVLASEVKPSIGLYNPDSSECGKGISREVRQYLFEVCFLLGDGDEDAEAAAKMFVNYLLAGFEHDYSNPKKDGYWAPMKNKYAEILGEKELTEYWAKNGAKIKKMSRRWDPETKVYTYNYIANYRDDLEPLYKELDTLLTQEETEGADET